MRKIKFYTQTQIIHNFQGNKTLSLSIIRIVPLFLSLYDLQFNIFLPPSFLAWSLCLTLVFFHHQALKHGMIALLFCDLFII